MWQNPVAVFLFRAMPSQGWIQDVTEEFSRCAPKAVLYRESDVILPGKSFRTEFLGNGISSIVRPSWRVVMSHLFLI